MQPKNRTKSKVQKKIRTRVKILDIETLVFIRTFFSIGEKIGHCMETADNTKERLLAMAERLFAEKGYDGVSVREITHCAECNLAAINYYFGNKKTFI
jgi:hypothetical protein